jgi:uncharacterized protein (TIGR02117 family)
MKKILAVLFILLSSVLLFASQNDYIYVVSLRKHSGIILSKQDVDISYLTNADKYKNEEYIEYGYGDREYYLSPNSPSFYLSVRALFWPTESVMRVTKVNLEYYKTAKDIDLSRLKITKSQLILLKQYIKDSFLLKKNKASPVGCSTYGEGYFYAGSRDFYLFNTCNGWVAKALRYSKFDVNAWLIVTRADLEQKVIRIAQ